MRIETIRTLAGPNVHNHKPVLIMRLDLEDMADKESFEVVGFVERLQTGTYFSHITEHVALELSEAAGIPAYFGKARHAGAPGLYNIIVEYKSEEGMRHLLRTAVELVEALIKGEEFQLEERLEAARHVVADFGLGPSTRSI